MKTLANPRYAFYRRVNQYEAELSETFRIWQARERALGWFLTCRPWQQRLMGGPITAMAITKLVIIAENNFQNLRLSCDEHLPDERSLWPTGLGAALSQFDRRAVSPYQGHDRPARSNDDDQNNNRPQSPT